MTGNMLQLSEHPDIPGVYYGAAQCDDAVVHIDILPPAYLWAGATPPNTDSTRWCVYADGRLLGRIEREEDVGPALLPLLEARTQPKASSGPYDREES
jgi:hypothetical protein